VDETDAVTVSGVTAGGDATISNSTQDMTLSGVTAGGNATLSALNGSLVQGAGTVTGTQVGLNATTGSVGLGGAIATTAGTLTGTATGGYAVAEADAVTVGGVSAGGDVTISNGGTAPGDMTLLGVTAGGNATLSALDGSLVQGGGTVTANTVAANASSGVGSAGAAIATNANTLTGTAAGAGFFASEFDAATLSAITAATDVGITGGGDLTLSGVTAGGNATLGSASNLVQGTGTVTGGTVAMNAGSSVGTANARIATNADTLTGTTGAGYFASEANAATLSAITAGTDVGIAGGGDLTLSGVNAGGTATLSSATSLLQGTGFVAGGTVGLFAGSVGSGTPIQTAAGTLTGGADAGGYSIIEVDGAALGGINVTNGGDVTLVATNGSFTQGAGEVVADALSITANGGSAGTSSGSLAVRANTFAANTGSGVFLTDPDNLDADITTGGPATVETDISLVADVASGGPVSLQAPSLTPGSVTGVGGGPVNGDIIFNGTTIAPTQSFYAATGQILINTNPSAGPISPYATIVGPGDLTLQSGLSFSMNPLDKLTTAGVLTIEGLGGGNTGTARLSDISAFEIHVRANAIELQTRPDGDVATRLDDAGAPISPPTVVRDNGMDLVANLIEFSTLPTLLAFRDGRTYSVVLATQTGQEVIGSVPSDPFFARRAIFTSNRALTPEDLQSGSLNGFTPDLLGRGAVVAGCLDCQTAGLINQEETAFWDLAEPPEPPPTPDEVLAFLNQCDPADPNTATDPKCQEKGEAAAGTMTSEAALDAQELYRELVKSKATTDRVGPNLQQGIQACRAAGAGSGTELRSCLASKPQFAQSVEYLDRLELLFAQFTKLGLAPGGLQTMREEILQEIITVLELEGVTVEDLGAAIGPSAAVPAGGGTGV
jgi:hypothetical protein